MTTVETIYLVGAALTGAIVLLMDYHGKVFPDELSSTSQIERLGWMFTFAAVWPLSLVVIAMSIKIHIRFPGQWW